MSRTKGISKLMAVVIAVIGIAALMGGGYYFLTLPRAPPAKDKILIGVANSLTGKYADLGRYHVRGQSLWRDMVNEKGGIYVAEYDKKLPVEFVIYDSSSDPAKETELTERLITLDKVDFVLGGYGGSQVFAASTIAEKYGIPYFNTQGFAEAIFTRGYKWVFSTCPTSPMFAESALKVLYHPDWPEAERCKTAAILVEESATPMDHVTFIKKFIGEWKLPLKIVFEDRFKVGTTDFTSPLLKIKATGAEAFFFIGYVDTTLIVTRQMKEVGYYPVYFQTAAGASVPEYIRELGEDANGAMAAYIAGPEMNPAYAKGIAELWDRYQKLYKPEEWHYCVATGFSGGQLLEAAIAKAGSLKPEAIRKAILEQIGTILTTVGTVKVAEDGHNEKSYYVISQIQNKKHVVVWPKEAMIPGTKLIWPAKKPK